MKLIWHIFKKDFRSQYLTFLLWTLSGIYFLLWILSGMTMTWQGNENAMVRDWLAMVAGISFLLLLFIQVVGVVQEDSLIDSTAFWKTRPISPGRMLAAKSLFVIGLPMIAPLAGFAVSRFFRPEHPAIDWREFLALLSFALVTGGLAACTKDLIRCSLGLVTCLILYSVASGEADHWFRPIVLQQIRQMTQMLIHHQSTTLFRPKLPWFAHLPAFMITETILGVAGAGAMLIQYFTRRTAVTLSLLLAGVLGAAVASSYCRCNSIWGVPSNSSAVQLDPQVKSILAGAAKFYAGANNFEADIESVTQVETDARNRKMDLSFHVALLRPASFSLVVTAGWTGDAIISNGKTLITYRPGSKKYTSTVAPADLSELLNRDSLIYIESGLALGFEDLWQQDPIQTFEAKLRRSEYIGSEEIGGVAAQHVRLTERGCVADYWIADGPQPLLLQAKITENSPGHNGPEKLVRTSTYANWRVNQPVPVDTFQFRPPSQAMVVNEFFSRTLHPLVGKMERDFELNDLDGKPVKLSDLRGKTVILDFWTTSCSASLSVVADAISKRNTQGVVFYAVNLMESADKILAFQKGKGLDFPVLLDTDGAVAKHYFAKLYLDKGIPESVLIDKDGRIEAVNVGCTPGLEKELGQKLDDLIAGKSLLPGVAPSAPAKGP